MPYKDFSSLSAATRLLELARKPFDLSRAGALSPQRIRDYRSSACGFDLLYATERLDEPVLDALQALADEAGLDRKSTRLNSVTFKSRMPSSA